MGENSEPPPGQVCSPLDEELVAGRGRVYGGADREHPILTCWHAEWDTLPWVEKDAQVPDRVAVMVPIGAWSAWGETPHVVVTVEIDGQDPRRFSTDDGGGVVPLLPSAFLRDTEHRRRLRGEPGLLERRWHRVDLADAVATVGDHPESFFFLLRIPDIAPDAQVVYTLAATTPLVTTSASSRFALRASSPTFTYSDVRAVNVEPAAGGDIDDLGSWVLLVTSAGDYVHVRLDAVSTMWGAQGTTRPPVRMIVGDTVVDLGADRDQLSADQVVALPLWDRDTV